MPPIDAVHRSINTCTCTVRTFHTHSHIHIHTTGIAGDSTSLRDSQGSQLHSSHRILPTSPVAVIMLYCSVPCPILRRSTLMLMATPRAQPGPIAIQQRRRGHSATSAVESAADISDLMDSDMGLGTGLLGDMPLPALGAAGLLIPAVG